MVQSLRIHGQLVSCSRLTLEGWTATILDGGTMDRIPLKRKLELFSVIAGLISLIATIYMFYLINESLQSLHAMIKQINSIDLLIDLTRKSQ